MAEALTTYERLAAQRANLLWSVRPSPLLLAALAGVGAYHVARSVSLGILTVPSVVISCLFTYFVAKRILEAVWPWYSKRARTLRTVEGDIGRLSRRAAELYDSVPKRSFRSQFKKHYDLSGRNIEEFEQLLAIGMRHERREVWVAAFCQSQHVVRVTATIGSAYRCSPSDDIARWPARVKELQCTSVRQYHNHPGTSRSTSPSPQDRLTSRGIEKLLAGRGVEYHSYIVFWNEIGEYRILEYDGNDFQRLVRVFDAAA